MSPVEPPHERGTTPASVLPCAVSSYHTESGVRGIASCRLEIPDVLVQQNASPCPSKSESHRRGAAIMGEFLAGPIDFGWLERAAQLPGAALHIAILVQHLAKLRRLEWVPVSNRDAARLGVKPDAKSRAILALQEARLVEVKKQPGQSPRVKPTW